MEGEAKRDWMMWLFGRSSSLGSMMEYDTKNAYEGATGSDGMELDMYHST